MGQTITIHCDDCRGTSNVHPVTVIRTGDKRDSWEVDLCDKCYTKRFSKLIDASRKPTVPLRPQNRAKKTEITSDNL